jgi:hypothetical protein
MVSHTIKRTKHNSNINNATKKYFKHLSHNTQLECSAKVSYYQHPQNTTYSAVFPFIIDYNEAQKKIFNNLLPESTGLTIEEWLEENHILSGKCKRENPSHKSHKSDKETKCNHEIYHSKLQQNHHHGNHEHHEHQHGHHHHHKIELFEPIKKEINYKMQSSVYELINTSTVINTFNYLFQKFSTGIYVQIKDGKINSFHPFINTNLVNDWSSLINLPEKYKSLEEYFLDKQKVLGGKIKFVKNKDLWGVSNCLLQTEKMTSINDSHWSEIYNMLEMTCMNHTIDDVDFFINIKAFPVLKNNFTEPFNYIHGIDKLLTNQYYSSYHPILSTCTNDTFGDLPYPSAEDWRLITQQYFRNSCENKYLYPTCNGHDESNSNSCDKDNMDWDEKKTKAYFLGDSSGCGVDIKDNIRLKLINIASKNRDLIHADLTRFSKRDKVVLDEMGKPMMGFHHPDDFKFSPIGQVKGLHRQYKYLISAPSYGIDPEFPYYLSLGGLVLKVESEYNTWYDHLLKPFQHYLPIKNDLSNLLSTIRWANTHQDVCMKIAKNGNLAFKKFFNHKTVTEYMNYLLNSIAHHRLNTSSLMKKYQEYEAKVKIITPLSIPPPEISKINFRDHKLGIIIPYLRSDNSHKSTLKEVTNRLIEEFRKYPKLKFKIIICEQSKDYRKFNRGQLINLGLLIAKKHNCTHIVVNGLNIPIISEMIPYYMAFTEADKGVVNIGFNWSDYYQKKYFSSICLWNLEMLYMMGGYSNQIWGLESIDRILYHRYIKLKKNNIFIPILRDKLGKYELSTWGQIIDHEYQQVKILSDWYLEKYDDLSILSKYLDEIINTYKRRGSRCRDSEHQHQHQHNHNDDEIKITEKRYNNDLKILDKHQHHKEVEHYTFKLITKLYKNIIE